MKKNELTKRVYKNNSDNFVAVSFKGMDVKEWKNLTHAELIEFVENCASWDDVDAEVYASALEDVGLDYASYDDPDMMWEDYLRALEA